MAIIWEVADVQLEGGMLALSVVEVVDGVQGEIYTARINNNRPDKKKRLLALLKMKIVAARARAAKQLNIQSKLDLSNFEIFLNT